MHVYSCMCTHAGVCTAEVLIAGRTIVVSIVRYCHNVTQRYCRVLPLPQIRFAELQQPLTQGQLPGALLVVAEAMSPALTRRHH